MDAIWYDLFIYFWVEDYDYDYDYVGTFHMLSRMTIIKPNH